MADANKVFWEWLQALPADAEGWRELPGSLRSQHREWGYGSPKGPSGILQSWVRNGNLEVRKRGKGGTTSQIGWVRFTGAQTFAEQVDERAETGASRREVLLAFLRNHATERGFLNVSIDKARRSLHLSKHDFIKLLFDLKDEGLVSFATKGTGVNLEPYNVRLRPAGTVYRSAGATEANEEAPEPTPQPGPQPGANGAESFTLAARPEDVFATGSPQAMSLAFPLLSRLMVRMKAQEARSRAAAELERAGLVEEAIALLEHERFEPLEQEIARFLQQRLRAESEELARAGASQDDSASGRPSEGVNSPDDPVGAQHGGD